jgi:hypothetical protein
VHAAVAVEHDAAVGAMARRADATDEVAIGSGRRVGLAQRSLGTATG